MAKRKRVKRNPLAGGKTTRQLLVGLRRLIEKRVAELAAVRDKIRETTEELEDLIDSADLAGDSLTQAVAAMEEAGDELSRFA